MCAISTSTSSAPTSRCGEARWYRILPASCLAMAGYGTFVYGSSAFISPVALEAPTLAVSVVPFGFAIRSATFAICNLAFGSLFLRGPVFAWVLTAEMFMFGGCACAFASISASPPAPAGFYASMVIAGVATALYYIPVYQPMIAWFPDRKGLVAGCAGVGQATGGSVWNAVAPALAQQSHGSGLFLVYGGVIGMLWFSGVLVTWPTSGRPVVPPRRCPRSMSSLLASVHGARHAIMLWAWLACTLLSGFALYAVLLYWLEVALALQPAQAGAVSTGFGMAFLVGRLGLGCVYDRLGSHTFARALHWTNLSLHAVLGLQQIVDRGEHQPTTEAACVVPLLILLLLCNAGAVTMWGPLTVSVGPLQRGAFPRGMCNAACHVCQARVSAGQSHRLRLA